MSKLPAVSFDVDGTLANFLETFLGHIMEVSGKVIDWSEVTKIPIEGNGLVTHEEVERAWDLFNHTPFSWAMLTPFKDVNFNLLDTYMEVGEFLGYIVTRRPDLKTPYNISDARYLTLSWLQKYGLRNLSGIVIDYGKDRADVLSNLGIDAHLDDDPKVFERLIDRGINAYLINRPWNKHVDTDKRVYTVTEFLDKAVFREACNANI